MGTGQYRSNGDGRKQIDFRLTEEQKQIQNLAKAFCRNEVEPIARELDKAGRIPDDLLQKYADMGLFGMTVPKEYRDAGLGDLTHILAIQLAYAGSLL